MRVLQTKLLNEARNELENFSMQSIYNSMNSLLIDLPIRKPVKKQILDDISQEIFKLHNEITDIANKLTLVINDDEEVKEILQRVMK